MVQGKRCLEVLMPISCAAASIKRWRTKYLTIRPAPFQNKRNRIQSKLSWRKPFESPYTETERNLTAWGLAVFQRRVIKERAAREAAIREGSDCFNSLPESPEEEGVPRKG